MRPKNIRHCIVSALCITALFASVSLSAQMRQARGAGQSNTQNAQNDNGQMSTENKQALREIEMMRQMIRERQEQQAEQRRVLQELQQVIGGDAPMPAAQSQYEEPNAPNQQPAHTQERVTSGSVLSQMEAEEREDIGTLQQKYNLEIQVAQKEIEMLKKQLSIANRQLDQCQTSNLSVNNNSYNDSFDAPAYSEPKPQKAAKPQKQKKVKQQQAQQAQPATQTEMSSENKQAMREIEMMRQMLKERQEQEAEQRKMLQDLQRALN